MPKSLTKLSNHQSSDFAARLAAYKQDIDNALAVYVRDLETQTAEQFGAYPLEAVMAFTAVLSRGGKRVRGALAMVGYEMFGGKDSALITKAACALEIMNTYILIADDIQDRSPVRRGGKTAHTLLADYHGKSHLAGDSAHFGNSVAINSFLIAQHYAMNLLASLPADSDTRIRAIENVNRCFIVTAHGQTLDIFNEAVEKVSEKQVLNVLEWKTAYYTFINPLQLGAILAGASDAELVELAAYGLHAGKVFQLTDDILGIFSDESVSGKNPLDDIKEGKRTLLTVYALEHAAKPDAYFLEQCLGNQELTMAEFEQCKQIITNTGALAYARKQAAEAADAASTVIVKNTNWPENTKHFLLDLVQYLVDRKS